jgi:uncharacterized YigZ family protein
MPTDSYKTIATVSEGLFKDKGSKFLSFSFPVESEDQVKSIVKEVKKKYYDARHHCYAYKIGIGENNYRVNDDGEPSGTAGKPIYGQILSSGLSDILIVVVRYFGGILLGTSGLINAYKSSAQHAIANAQIVEKIVKQELEINFSYEMLSQVMRIIKEENLEIISQQLTESCHVAVNVREAELSRMKEKFANTYGIEVVN